MIAKSAGITNSIDENLIKWDPKFKIGIPLIDAQHEHLVKLCNDFYQSLLKSKSNKNEDYHALVKQTLETCLNYAATHFKEEERLMEASKFSGYKQHKDAHNQEDGQQGTFQFTVRTLIQAVLTKGYRLAKPDDRMWQTSRIPDTQIEQPPNEQGKGISHLSESGTAVPYPHACAHGLQVCHTVLP